MPVTADATPTVPKVLLRAADLLDVAMNYYLPGSVEVDDKSVRDRVAKEDSKLDDVLSPLVVLLTRLCASSEECKRYLRERLIPPNL